MSGPGATAWFRHEDVAPGVTRIWEPGVHPFLQANIWHIAGSTCDLWIDAGLGVASLEEAFPERWRQPAMLVLTHGHLDHSGGAGEFTDVRMHPADRPLVPGRLPLTAQSIAAWLGVPPELCDPPVLEHLASRGTDLMMPGAPDRSSWQSLGEGDLVDLGHRQFLVVELPGHTPGSIGLWDQVAQVLITGDVLYDGRLIDDLGESDPRAYAQSMRRILDLNPALVLPGHGSAFDGDRAVSIAEQYLSKPTNTEGKTHASHGSR